MSRWSAAVVVLLITACAPTLERTGAGVGPGADTASRPGERPIPYPLEAPPEFLQAVERGTRTPGGSPGPGYWQNWTDYDIRTRLDPASRRLVGSAMIRYHNRSPDTLQVLVLDLAQNVHAPGATRNEPAEVTGGVELGRVVLRGEALTEGGRSGPRYMVQGTKLILVPARRVGPGETVEMEIDWSFAIPQAGAGGRMGYSRDNLLFLAYWYPQMAVYDDVIGWHPDDFLGLAEFYAGFGNYRYTVEAPVGWVIRGTGELRDPESLLAPTILERLRLAERVDTVVRVFTAADAGRATRSSSDGLLRWTFEADSVRDVAFSATRDFLWDATRSPVGGSAGGEPRHTRIEALYRSTAPRWRNVARYSQHAVSFFSRYLDHPYPWPHMTAVEGAEIIGGGMEFPMMTIMGDYTAAGDDQLYNVTAHEVAHMWVPMIVATDERRYGWMDEGTTTFNEAEARTDFLPGVEHHLEDRASYLRAALAGREGEIMRWSDFHYSLGEFGTASYPKPSVGLVALRGILGEETFTRAHREFIARWAYRHPYPWDLWSTFEDVSGRDLSWFWRGWYHETWVLDQAVGSVTSAADGVTIVIEDRGDLPMPVHLTITRGSGAVELREIPVDVWLTGARTTSITLPAGDPVVRVEIDAGNHFPDADRTNNRWSR
jgi:hypothetical protein